MPYLCVLKKQEQEIYCSVNVPCGERDPSGQLWLISLISSHEGVKVESTQVQG
ncbi:hypothetical protein DPMN_168271 [Dreissena polymorpha]|uniref:Uncharacterized protein n=1 Tax=Dreissena polymorpha TaxID=45954 RepID=A0A9D4F4T2_DREPO|nr:hypothetical protein DPMN_168271 [Dreissena polymorpha]